MMKNSLNLVFYILFVSTVAQGQNPIHWEYSAKKLSEKVYEFHVTATMDGGWHIYAMQQPKDAISVPTKIVFNANPLILLDGKLKETGKKETYTDHNAGITQYQYADKVEYTQVLKLKATAKTNITGTITFQACTGEMCLPPKTIPFQVIINN